MECLVPPSPLCVSSDSSSPLLTTPEPLRLPFWGSFILQSFPICWSLSLSYLPSVLLVPVMSHPLDSHEGLVFRKAFPDHPRLRIPFFQLFPIRSPYLFFFKVLCLWEMTLCIHFLFSLPCCPPCFSVSPCSPPPVLHSYRPCLQNGSCDGMLFWHRM